MIEKDELPKIFTEDISHHFEKNVQELSRMREKKKVMYDDGLSEAQWLKAMDDDDDSVEDAIKRRMSRINARKRNKAIREGLLVEDINDDEVGEEDDEEFEAAAQPRKRQRRSRTPIANSVKKEQAENDEDGSDAEEDQDVEMNDVETNGNVVSDGLESQCLAVLDDILQLTDESDGHKISDIFLTLPSRKQYPDYYSIIKTPISINQIKKKIKNEEYASLDDFAADLKQMCLNAKTYNEEESFVYTDATVIENLIASRFG